MGRHGIARNYEHSIESRDEFSVTFKLASNKETLEAYPFRFTLKTTYSLVSERTLSQTFCVANDGSVQCLSASEVIQLSTSLFLVR